jgi:hypothetical protein
VRSRISWYVCSMYLGTKGDFFSYTCTFCAHLPRCCALLCGRPLSYDVCTVQFLKLRILCWSTNCVRMRMVLMTICRARKRKKKFWFHAVSYAKKKRSQKNVTKHNSRDLSKVSCSYSAYEFIWHMNWYEIWIHIFRESRKKHMNSYDIWIDMRYEFISFESHVKM